MQGVHVCFLKWIGATLVRVSRILAVASFGLLIAVLLLHRDSAFVLLSCGVPLAIACATGLAFAAMRRHAAASCVQSMVIAGCAALLAATHVRALVAVFSAVPPFPFAALPLYVTAVMCAVGIGSGVVVWHVRRSRDGAQA
jgi:hypothetical protein